MQARFHARPNETNELTNMGVYGAVCLNPAVCIPFDGRVQGNPRNYLQPVGVQVGRMVKLSFQFNF